MASRTLPAPREYVFTGPDSELALPIEVLHQMLELVQVKLPVAILVGGFELDGELCLELLQPLVGVSSRAFLSVLLHGKRDYLFFRDLPVPIGVHGLQLIF